MFVGTGNLDARTQEKITALAAKEDAHERHLDLVAARAAEAMRVGTRLLIGSIMELEDQRLVRGQDSPEKQSARLWSAGVLHLLGAHAPNVGHLESSEVILASTVEIPVNLGAVPPAQPRRYSHVTARLDNIDVITDTMVGFRREFDPRGCKPADLLEGAVRMALYSSKDQRENSASVIEYTSAWMGESGMPSSYTGGERRLGDPGRIGEVAQQMLTAMLDPGLNPGYQTYEQLVAVSPQLGEQVLDMDRPLAEIEFDRIVPEWARVGAAA